LHRHTRLFAGSRRLDDQDADAAIRNEVAAAALNGKLLPWFRGGSIGGGQPDLKRTEEYDPASDR